MRIASIRVDGAVHTRKSFLGSLVNPYLVNDKPETLGSVLETSRRLGNLLQETDLFNTVEARLEKNRGPFAQPYDVDVVFKTKEKGRFYLNTSTQVGNDEGGAVR